MKTVFITGATSGIGTAFARAYASQGCSLILTGRRTDRLQALKEELDAPCRILPADLSDETQCRRLLEDVTDTRIDIFINNAGFGAAGSFLETSLDKEISMIRVKAESVSACFRDIRRRFGISRLTYSSDISA